MHPIESEKKGCIKCCLPIKLIFFQFLLKGKIRANAHLLSSGRSASAALYSSQTSSKNKGMDKGPAFPLLVHTLSPSSRSEPFPRFLKFSG